VKYTRVGRLKSYMQDKQKVTLYLPPGLHRQLKIRSAVDSEPMSSMVERAIVFYLTNPEVVDEVEANHGGTHRVYSCPECSSSVVVRDGEMVALGNQPGVMAEELTTLEGTRSEVGTDSQGEQELVPC